MLEKYRKRRQTSFHGLLGNLIRNGNYILELFQYDLQYLLLGRAFHTYLVRSGSSLTAEFHFHLWPALLFLKYYTQYTVIIFMCPKFLVTSDNHCTVSKA
jgi:hypothetical protein